MRLIRRPRLPALSGAAARRAPSARNRAANDVRAAFNKNGGALAEPGAVNYLFSRSGVILVPAADTTEDDVLMAGLEAGIEDVTLDGDTFTITRAGKEKLATLLRGQDIADGG